MCRGFDANKCIHMQQFYCLPINFLLPRDLCLLWRRNIYPDNPRDRLPDRQSTFPKRIAFQELNPPLIICCQAVQSRSSCTIFYFMLKVAVNKVKLSATLSTITPAHPHLLIQLHRFSAGGGFVELEHLFIDLYLQVQPLYVDGTDNIMCWHMLRRPWNDWITMEMIDS